MLPARRAAAAVPRAPGSRPFLTGLGEREQLFRSGVDLDCHITDIVNLLHFEELRDAILVGHSYGGMVITGAAGPSTGSATSSTWTPRHPSTARRSPP